MEPLGKHMKRHYQDKYERGFETLDKYEPLSVLANGQFGKLVLVREMWRPHAIQLKALKVTDKRSIIDKRLAESVFQEQQYLRGLDHPFLLATAGGTFQTQRYLITVTEGLGNKSVGTLADLVRDNKTVSGMEAKFFLAQLTTALEYLHTSNVVVRNLGASSVLLDSEGNARVADFTMALPASIAAGYNSDIEYQTTLNMAPEVAAGKACTFAADWYSMGTIAHLLLTGRMPDHKERPIMLPNDVDRKTRMFVARLLRVLPQKRFNDAERVRATSFFKGTNWLHVISKQIQSPVKVIPQNAYDQECLDFVYEEESTKVSFEEQQYFHNFS